MATNDIPLNDPTRRPADTAPPNRPQGSTGQNSDLSEGPTGGGNGLTANFNANSGGVPLIGGWSVDTLPSTIGGLPGGTVAGSDSGMALHRRIRDMARRGGLSGDDLSDQAPR